MSYSQHGEDTSIFELLGKPETPGFYIDIGAHSPNHESVTKFFYERGWNGINVEPLQTYYNQLLQQRPRDINLNLACGTRDEEVITLYAGDGLTTGKREYAVNQANIFFIPTLSLKTICEAYVRNQSIDFLKIDVEGWEKHVIEGADWNRYRPKVLCIEATQPMTTNPVYDEWEPLVFEAGYRFVKADMVNRFYVTNE